MEAGDVDQVIKDPQHPYTQLLVDSIPWPNLDRRWGAQPIRAREAGGSLDGCRFQPRCPRAMAICGAEPPLFRIGDRHTASCFLYDRQPQVAQERLSELLPA
jgi:oligopeptide/dipeptide ABC transporter ATP-binding protein